VDRVQFSYHDDASIIELHFAYDSRILAEDGGMIVIVRARFDKE
jgi:hypothetical protein